MLACRNSMLSGRQMEFLLNPFFLQLKGIAMGTLMGPNYAYLFNKYWVRRKVLTWTVTYSCCPETLPDPLNYSTNLSSFVNWHRQFLVSACLSFCWLCWTCIIPSIPKLYSPTLSLLQASCRTHWFKHQLPHCPHLFWLSDTSPLSWSVFLF